MSLSLDPWVKSGGGGGGEGWEKEEAASQAPHHTTGESLSDGDYIWDQILSLPLTGCVTWGKLHNFSGLSFFHS